MLSCQEIEDESVTIEVSYLLLTMTASSSLRACCSSNLMMLCSNACAFRRFCSSENCSASSSRRSSTFYDNGKSLTRIAFRSHCTLTPSMQTILQFILYSFFFLFQSVCYIFTSWQHFQLRYSMYLSTLLSHCLSI